MIGLNQDTLPYQHVIRSKAFTTVVALAILLVVIGFTTAGHVDRLSVSSALTQSREFLTKQGSASAAPERPPNAPPAAIHLPNIKSKYAFATFLVGTDKEIAPEDDNYLIATRILAYQLLHAEETKSQIENIPFIVLVTEKVKEPARRRLRHDGAIVLQVPALSSSWLNPGIPEWDHVMTKLRLWEMLDFERIAFVDADTVLAQPIDGIFTDTAAEERATMVKQKDVAEDGTPLPSTFVFAGNAEQTHDHHFPPKDDSDWPNRAYMNAGFFVLKPDLAMLKYYITLLNTPDSFDSALPEQNLLNHVHRWGGSMPWTQLNTTYNIHYPTMRDIELGAKSVHEKWWVPKETKLRLWMENKRARMAGYFEAMDKARGSRSPL